MSEGAGWADAPGFCRCARSIENFCRIKMVVARASGTDLASILKRNTFLTLAVRPAGGVRGSARDGGTRWAPGRVRHGGGTPLGTFFRGGGHGVPPPERYVQSGGDPRESILSFFCRCRQFCRMGQNARKSRMAQSRRQVRPRSSRLQHSASFRARNPNKASMTLMLAAASMCTTDALERQLAPP